MNIVYGYRVKNLNGLLNKQARAVNYVWNFCNETQKHALKWEKKWPTAFDFVNLTSGSSKLIELYSSSIVQTCLSYAKSRIKSHKSSLNWRGRKSLGWIPLSGRSLIQKGENFAFDKKIYRVFKSRPLPIGAKIKDGSSFSQDARGNWYLNVCIEVPDVAQRSINSGVGIDLGLKALATLSTGEIIENPRHLAAKADKLVKSQRARKKRQTRNIHAQVKNARADFHHKLSHRLVNEFDYIAAGNVNAAGLAKTSM